MKQVKAKKVYELIYPECGQVQILYKYEIIKRTVFMDSSIVTYVICDSCNIKFEVKIPVCT